MTAGEQIKKAEGRAKARAQGKVPDQAGRMRDRIVKDPINPRALAVHNPRMSQIRSRMKTASRDAARRKMLERKFGAIRYKKPSFIQRIRTKLRTFMKGKGHR